MQVLFNRVHFDAHYMLYTILSLFHKDTPKYAKGRGVYTAPCELQEWRRLLVSLSQTSFFFYIGVGKKGSGTLSIETAVLASTLVGVSVECDFLDVLNAIDRDAASCESR